MENLELQRVVILLHGLGRTARCFKLLEKHLKQEGYRVINQSYPSRHYKIEDLAEIAIPNALKECPKDAPISFVTHSLGGILVREYLRKHTIENLDRVVMLGPPNHGSEIVDKLGWLPGFTFINGPAGLQLETKPDGYLAQLGPVNFKLGIVAGTLNKGWYLEKFLPEPNDGKVTVASTRITGEADHICLPVSHGFMMNKPMVIEKVLAFLKTGSFKHQKS